MPIQFYKYQGTGNDFVLFDNRSGQIDRTRYDWFNFICDRRFGIGADGVMLLQEREGYDFEMLYFNADGLPGSMCGNGGRCMVQFAKRLGIDKAHYHFLASDGDHDAIITGDEVSLHMRDVLSVELHKGQYILNTGSPHVVLAVDDVMAVDVNRDGAQLRYDPLFAPGGTNVNYIHIQGETMHIRTYERGVEQETLSCGTGVTASALVSALMQNLPFGIHEVQIRTMGGALRVQFHYHADGSFTDIYLIGPGTFVFSGEINA